MRDHTVWESVVRNIPELAKDDDDDLKDNVNVIKRGHSHLF